MALVINDRVKETSTTSGQGTLNLDGASQDFITFVEGIGTGKQTYYAIVETGNNLFEIGIGTVTDATPDTLSRDEVISNSSGSTSKVNFGSSTKDVFCTIPGKRTISPVMTATEFVVTHNSTLSETQTMDSGVLAGPVSITGTITVTGNLIIL